MLIFKKGEKWFSVGFNIDIILRAEKMGEICCQWIAHRKKAWRIVGVDGGCGVARACCGWCVSAAVGDIREGLCTNR